MFDKTIISIYLNFMFDNIENFENILLLKLLAKVKPIPGNKQNKQKILIEL